MKCKTLSVSAVYEGESSKCAYARGRKHLEELKGAVRTNGMVIHNANHHDSLIENHFMMRVVRTLSRPLDRQIDESVRIKDSDADIIMNSGSEWKGTEYPEPHFLLAVTPGTLEGSSGLVSLFCFVLS